MKLTLKRTVDAPVTSVFQVYADFGNVAARVDGIQKIEMLTDDPVGIGSRFRETRMMFGRESTEEMEITEFEPNKKYTVEAFSCGAHFQTIFRFRPDGNATHVDVELNTRNVSLFSKLMSPLGFLMAGPMKKMIMSDIDQLKSYCEQPVNPQPDPGLTA
jgi:uncharacterized membrane protein